MWIILTVTLYQMESVGIEWMSQVAQEGQTGHKLGTSKSRTQVNTVGKFLT